MKTTLLIAEHHHFSQVWEFWYCR